MFEVRSPSSYGFMGLNGASLGSGERGIDGACDFNGWWNWRAYISSVSHC